jgi:hypothetical protein
MDRGGLSQINERAAIYHLSTKICFTRIEGGVVQCGNILPVEQIHTSPVNHTQVDFTTVHR